MKFVELFPFLSFQVLLLIVIVNTLLLKRRGVQVSNKSQKSNATKYIISPVFLIIFHLLLFELGASLFNISVFPEIISTPIFYSSFLQFLGIVITIISLILLVVTLIYFGKSFRFGMSSENKGKLVTNGIFRYSRNPFFVSILLYFIGIALIIPSLFFLFITLASGISIHFFILREEKFMKENFGEEYLNYSQKVRRYF